MDGAHLLENVTINAKLICSFGSGQLIFPEVVRYLCVRVKLLVVEIDPHLSNAIALPVQLL
jgi:hypothetical protein